MLEDRNTELVPGATLVESFLPDIKRSFPGGTHGSNLGQQRRQLLLLRHFAIESPPRCIRHSSDGAAARFFRSHRSLAPSRHPVDWIDAAERFPRGEALGHACSSPVGQGERPPRRSRGAGEGKEHAFACRSDRDSRKPGKVPILLWSLPLFHLPMKILRARL